MPVSVSASHRDSSPKELSPREVDNRRDAAVRRALSTPPKPKGIGEAERAGEEGSLRP